MQNNLNQPQPPKLLDQVAAKMRVKHYSLRTEKSYIDWIKRYIWHFDKRHPKDMGAVEIEAFLTHLAVSSIHTLACMSFKERINNSQHHMSLRYVLIK